MEVPVTEEKSGVEQVSREEIKDSVLVMQCLRCLSDTKLSCPGGR